MRKPFIYQRAERRGRERDRDDFGALRARVEEAVRLAQPLQHQRKELYEFYTGEAQRRELEYGLAQGDQLAKFREDIVIQNFVWASVEQYIAILLQQLPAPFVVSTDMEQSPEAEAATTWLQSYARVRNVTGEVEQAFRDCVVKGNGVLKAYYDRRLEDVVLRALDPDYVVPDPAATRLEDCEFLVLKAVYSEQLAKKLWPKLDPAQAEEVTVETASDELLQSAEANRRLVIYEVYHQFGEKVTVYTGEQILLEADNPLAESPLLPHRYPISVFSYQKRPGRFWSDGLVAQVRGIQTNINKLNLRINVHHRLVVNPVMIVHGHPQGVSTDPGTIIRCNTDAEKAYYLVPPPLPAEVYQTLANAKQAMDVISGVHEITRGIRPRGVQSGIALEALQQMAQVRLSGPARNWGQHLADIWQRVLMLMQTYYAEPRRLPVLDGTRAGVVEIQPEQLSAMRVVTDEETGEPVYDPKLGDYRKQVVPLPLQVVMQQDAELPLSAPAQAEMALQLVQLGLLDQQAVLEALRWKDRDKVLERMERARTAQLEGQFAAHRDLAAAQQQQSAQQSLADTEAALQAALTPEQLETLRGALTGQLGEDALANLMLELPPEAAMLVQNYLAAAQAVVP